MKADDHHSFSTQGHDLMKLLMYKLLTIIAWKMVTAFVQQLRFENWCHICRIGKCESKYKPLLGGCATLLQRAWWCQADYELRMGNPRSQALATTFNFSTHILIPKPRWTWKRAICSCPYLAYISPDTHIHTHAHTTWSGCAWSKRITHTVIITMQL